MFYSAVVNRCSLRSYLALNKLRYLFTKRKRQPLNLIHVLSIIARNAKEKPSFVQIGAFDGVSNDPLFDIVRKWNWNGVLVEPVPSHFNRLKSNYAGFNNLNFENVAISDKSGEFQFYQLPAQYDDPPWLQQIGSFSYEAIAGNLKDSHPELIQYIVATSMPAITLQQLLDRRQIERVDVMVIDVEGHEHKVLAGIEQMKSKPRIIVFEEGCMAEVDLQQLLGKLKDASYRIYSGGADLIAIHQTAINAY